MGSASLRRVLILGGTSEARALAAELVDAPGVEVVSSLAGRVRDPRLPDGAVRVGGFGGVDGLVEWLRDNDIDAVVDATHPFAARITGNAVQACAAIGVPLLVLRRPQWTPGPGDRWHVVPDLRAAAAIVPALGSRVFLTIGRQGVDAFAGVAARFLIRAIDSPDVAAPADSEILLARGPFTLGDEIALLREHRVEVLVTKNSGGSSTSAKLDAARALDLPVVMVARSPLPDGVISTADPDVAAVWARGHG